MGKEGGAGEKMDMEDLECLGQQIRREGQRSASPVFPYFSVFHPRPFPELFNSMGSPDNRYLLCTY